MSKSKFNPKARDGDNDGLVQDGTVFERPIEVEVLEDTVEDVPVVEDLPKVEKKESAKASVEANDDVALFTDGNIYQSKWGELSKGYNVVKKEAAAFWLPHRTVRLATPEEIAKHYGVK